MSEFSMADVFNDYIEKVTETREPDGLWHPSGMFDCERSSVLAMRGAEVTNPPDAVSKRRFKMGHILHELLQGALWHHPGVKSVYPEFEINIPSWHIAGHGDALVEMEDGTWFVIEIKSTKYLKYTPKEAHRKQGSVYAVAARDFGVEVPDDLFEPEEKRMRHLEPLGDKLKGLLLVYITKNDLDIRQFWYPYLPDHRTEVEETVERLDVYRTDEESLPEPIAKKNWYTDFCSFKGSGQCCGDETYEW